MQRQSSLMLTRTSSSLLRSPTLRSSFHSLSTLADVESDPEEAKPHSPPPSASYAAAAPARSAYVSGFLILLLIVFLLLLLILFVSYHRNEPQSLRKLSLALAGIAVSFLVLKRTRLFLLRRRRESVRWFIGDEDDHVENPSPCPKISGRLMKEGVEFYRNGDFYEGNFHRGKCNGSGVYNFYGQGRYEGDWIDGQFDGYGIEHWAKGSRYQGHYRLGLRHGFGVYRFHNGDSFAGEWVGGQSHGRGVQSCSDGSCYAGDFKFGVKHGLGFYHFRNGDRYAGEYFGDKIHGFGVYHFANGHCYEGSWHEGTRQGFGTYNFRSGEAKSGEWNCGALQNSLPPSDSNVHRFVQCGRNAAERATVLPSVEAQVSRAVAAANRAATAARLAAIRAVQNRAEGKFCYNEA